MCKIVQRSCLIECPIYQGRNLRVYTRTVVGAAESTLAFCNGCDEAADTAQCRRCMQSITLMYERGEPVPEGAFPPPLHLLGEADRVTGAEPG